MLLYFVSSALLLLIYCIGIFTGNLRYRKRIYIILSFILFFVILAFRNDYATDYVNYVRAYLQYGQMANTNGFFYYLLPAHFGEGLEKGFVYLCIIVYKIFRNPIFLFIFCALITLIPLWKFFDELFAEPSSFLIAVFFYITIGTYYEGFNVMRQMMAASISLIGFRYMIEKKYIKYLISIGVAALFHSSALVLAVSYFLVVPNRNITISKVKKFFLWVFGIVVIFSINILTQYYISYFRGGRLSYVQGIEQVSWKNIIFPLIIYFVCKLIESYNKRRCGIVDMASEYGLSFEICSNSAALWIILEICCIFVPLSTRFASYYSPFFIAYVTYTFEKISPLNKKFLTWFLIILFFGLRLYLARNNQLMNNYSVMFGAYY